MAEFNFTKKELEALPAPAKRALYYDTKREGLGLLVRPTGHKSFFWRRRVNYDFKWITIGSFPDLSIDQARESADSYNKMAAEWKRNKYVGPDPFKTPDKFTLGDLFAKYYETLKTKGTSPQRGPATEKSLKDTKSWYDAHLAKWADRDLVWITVERVRELHTKITKENGPVIANRVMSLLRRCINWGTDNELWRGENPAEKVKWNYEKPRERFVQPGDEMKRLLEAIEKEKHTNWDLHDFLLLSLFCGQRKSNLLAMRWEQIKMSVTGEAEWDIPVTKNGKSQKVPLLPEALTVLQERKRRATKNSVWVFPSDKSNVGHIKDKKKSWKRLRESAGISDVHIHDLRRTLGSYMAGSNASLPIIGKALGHSSIASTQVYARLNLDPVRQAMSAAVSGMKKTLTA